MVYSFRYVGMSTKVHIHLHHYGDFTLDIFKNNANYVGGSVGIIDEVDTNLISLLYLEGYVVKYNYSKTYFLYFQCDGHL